MPERDLSYEFRPKSLGHLKKALGEMDATVEWLEVGLRRLADLRKEFGPHRIREESERAGIFVTEFQDARITQHWSELRIVAVHSHFESFVKSFVRELGRDFKEKQKEKTI